MIRLVSFFKKIVAIKGVKMILDRMFLCGLYGIGLYHWAKIFQFGHMTFLNFDWPKEHAFYQILKQAVLLDQWPYFMSASLQNSHKFLMIPDTLSFFSPQIYLLKWVSIPMFACLNVLIAYSVGFLGLLWFKRSFHVSMLAFSVFYLLFNFNGHIVAHLSVGHSMWSGYFLWPFFITSFLLMTLDRYPKRCSVIMALTLFFMFLQGSLHLVVGSLFFLFFFVLFNPKQFKWIVLTCCLFFSLSAVRILPTLGETGVFFHYWGGGYSTVVSVLEGLLVGGSSHETTIFIDILGVLFVGVFGVYFRYKKFDVLRRFDGLNGPIFLMFLMSLHHNFLPIFSIPIHFFQTERTTTRFIIVPLLFLIALAVLVFDDRRLKWRSLKLDLWIWFGVYQLGLTFMRYSASWVIKPIETHVTLVSNTLVLGYDAFYTMKVTMGCVITGLTLMGVILYMIKKTKWLKRTT